MLDPTVPTIARIAANNYGFAYTLTIAQYAVTIAQHAVML